MPEHDAPRIVRGIAPPVLPGMRDKFRGAGDEILDDRAQAAALAYGPQRDRSIMQGGCAKC